MKISLLLFFALSNIFSPVFCGECPESLREAFEKDFNLSEKCGDDCVVLTPEMSFQNQKWTGFCFRNCYTLFPNWKCRGFDDDFTESKVFSRVNDTFCEIFTNGTHTEDKDCLREFNSVKCRTCLLDLPSASSQSSFENDSKSSLAPVEKCSSRKHISLSYISVFPTTPLTTYHTTMKVWESDCEENEHFFFEGHCYFITSYKNKDKQNPDNYSDLFINSTITCQRQHPGALGLAVETKEENYFVMKALQNLFNTTWQKENSILLTSGIKEQNSPGKWMGWDLKVNLSVIRCSDNNLNDYLNFYTINLCNNEWRKMSLPEILLLDKDSLWMVCKRLYNPKNIVPELHRKCIKLYRESECYNVNGHKNYCCANDENGNLWFGCPDKVTKVNRSGVECFWHCERDGYFSRKYPTCKGKPECSDKYNDIKYSAPIHTHAASGCRKGFWGYSTWYCGAHGKFVGRPDYSSCCIEESKACKTTDPELNFWMACSTEKALKLVACPPGSALKNAFAEWYCQTDGSFYGSLPDYSNCGYNSGKVCRKKDDYDREWKVLPGDSGKKICPPDTLGFCYWKCGKFSGEFESPEPNCSDCRPGWVDEVENMIKNETGHEKVMEVMENYTKVMNLKNGFRYVLNLTSDCVDLFKKQNINHSFSAFNKFLTSFSKIFKNVAGNPDVWSSFEVLDRKKYADHVLQITQNACFANLQNESFEFFNATLATPQIDGYDFFVMYNNSIKDSRFPLNNFHQSNWQLQVQEVDTRGSNFGAMGLVMNHSLSSLMFPQGNGTKKMNMNSPVVTFTVVVLRNNEPVLVPNITFRLSLRHINKTRFPETQIIRRKLHEGETPSGVIYSTICHHYKVSDWSTEGCVVTFSSKDVTNCMCRHLSSIVILMTVHKYIPNKSLETVSVICSGITIISLVLALATFYVFDSVKNERAFIGKNLCFCLIFGHFMLVTAMDKKFFYIPDNFCTVYAVFMHYTFMAAFSWMFIEGCHLYRMLVLVFDSHIEHRLGYGLIGYGVPLVVVCVTELVGLALQEQPYGQDELCWLKTPNYNWAFIGPVAVSTSINFFILITAMKLAISSKMRTEKTKLANIMIWIKGWISLSSLLGITWLIGLACINYDEAFGYIFVILNGLQGFFIFLFRCVFNEQYKTAFLRKFKFCFPASELKSTENIKTGAKLFAITQSHLKSSGDKNMPDSGYDTDILNRLDNQIHIQKDILKSLNKLTLLKNEDKENSRGIDLGIEITVTPAVSEEFLRNRLIIKRKQNDRFTKKKDKPSKGELDDFPELSFHSNYGENSLSDAWTDDGRRRALEHTKTRGKQPTN